MAEFCRRNIVLLFDSYSEDSKKLHNSFKQVNSDIISVVINDDGFLPEGTESVYGYFLGDFSESETYIGKPRYFNQIDLPDYWEIDADGHGGTIKDLNNTKGKIYFKDTSNNARKIKVVEWFDNNGKVRSSEHYNKYGVMYSKTAFNMKGERVNRSYYDSNGKEVIYENLVTGAIILNYKNAEIIFPNKTEFIVYFMKIRNYDMCRIYYNSLSYPFFVSERLTSQNKDDILFWQESKRDDIPGNMKIILDGKSSRTQLILVQKKEAYEKLIELGAPGLIVRKKGFIYPFVRENKLRKNALICTNSDQIEHLEDIVKELSDIKFNIAAVTTMSEKLLGMEKYRNVTLYPAIKNDVLEDLFLECDYYFDINKYDEICDAVYRAFLNNQVIFSFDETKHNVDFEPDISLYKCDEWQNMVLDIKETVANKEKTEQRLMAQRQKALSEDKKSYLLIS